MLVSELRTAGGEQGLFGDGPGTGIMEDWFDQSLAEHLASSGRMGMAASIRKEMGRG
jgi:Rod binding domain-containing protein